ncbi:MAG: internal scaffolding protein [Arizlama microvirus]|nr:MAG: internal scaffolding protein [Arizlama microvirus]
MSKSSSTLASNLSKLSTISPTSTPQTFISAYAPKSRYQLNFTGPGRTKQSFKDECNINVIMSRYMNTGVIDFVSKHQPHYADVTALDYQSAMQAVAQAQSMFHELPSKIRSRFENNPAAFLEFVQDPRNQAEAHELGLLKPDYQPPKPNATAAPVADSEPASVVPKPDK